MYDGQAHCYRWRLHPPPSSTDGIQQPVQTASVAASVGAGAETVRIHNGNDAKLPAGSVSNSKFSFKLHDDVYVRPKSAKELGIAGRIIQFVEAAGKSSGVSGASPKRRKSVEEVRVSIEQHRFGLDVYGSASVKDGIRPSRLFPIYDIHNGNQKKETLIILTPDTTNYRLLATSHLRPGDKVLEIGCSTGECTALLMRRLLLLKNIPCTKDQQLETTKNTTCGEIIAFDTGSDMIEQARARVLSEFNRFKSQIDDEGLHSIVKYHKVDAFADPKGAHSKALGNSEREPDIVVIDIGGNRELNGVIRMIRWVQSTFCNGRLIIVKSEALVDELSRSLALGESSTDARTMSPCVTKCGIIVRGQEWFSSLQLSPASSKAGAHCESNIFTAMPKYSHPLKAPLVMSPKDGSTPICRFHNYHPDGCKTHNNGGKCQLDHDHCHWCREAGHVALSCKKR